MKNLSNLEKNLSFKSKKVANLSSKSSNALGRNKDNETTIFTILPTILR